MSTKKTGLALDEHNRMIKAQDIVSRYKFWDKPKDELFSPREMAILKIAYPKTKFLVKYAIWKQKRHNGLYLAFIIDNFPGRTRPCAADHALEIISTRPLTDKEWVEELGNFGCNNRVMHMWDYSHIENMIEEDKNYGVETPAKFVEEAKKRGYCMQIIKPRKHGTIKS